MLDSFLAFIAAHPELCPSYELTAPLRFCGVNVFRMSDEPVGQRLEIIGAPGRIRTHDPQLDPNSDT